MFSIFNKRKAGNSGKRLYGGQPATLVSGAKKPLDYEDLTFHLDITVDDAMRGIDSRLSSLSRMEVGQAAKERGWATLHRELARHPVRPAASLLKGTGATATARPGTLQPVPAGRGHSRGWRITLSSAGVAVAIMAILLGTYGAGLLGNDDGGTVVVATTQTSDVPTTGSTDEITPTSDVTTDGTETTEVPVTIETTPATNGTSTTESTPDTTPVTGGSTTTTSHGTTPTTKPSSPITTGGQQMASAERVKDAKDAVVNLGDAVLAHFMNDGDIESVRYLVAPSARSSLTQMIASLEEPTSAQIIANSVKSLSSDTVRMTLEFQDVNDSRRFFITVRVNDQGATITAISAAS